MQKISWPAKYTWLHEYVLNKPYSVFEYKKTWDAMLYRLHGKIFALLLRNKSGTLLNLKCAPYLAIEYREKYPDVLPGWHMNKLHWISIALLGHTPNNICKELVDLSYDLIWQALPKKLKKIS